MYCFIFQKCKPEPASFFLFDYISLFDTPYKCSEKYKTLKKTTETRNEDNCWCQ